MLVLLRTLALIIAASKLLVMGAPHGVKDDIDYLVVCTVAVQEVGDVDYLSYLNLITAFAMANASPSGGSYSYRSGIGMSLVDSQAFLESLPGRTETLFEEFDWFILDVKDCIADLEPETEPEPEPEPEPERAGKSHRFGALRYHWVNETAK
ncbi:hypothetical protein DFP72DRAFT_1073351 [Ephemerocybe angulata]|uniref:Uncharacterized protein n=1 Tax=Ephemerocybe angulata TaxID=980116 RepID=A0A8H6LYX8_9AGAR|nr:hypothetical protein DFP72DRAFT_1073351 [Tulosesus angulatus]